MNTNKTIVIAVLAAAGAGLGCATAATERVDEDAAARLAQFEQTGEFETCLGLREITQITPVTETKLLVKVGAGKYYLNETTSRCNRATSGFTRLEYTTSLSQLCRNEIIRVVDNSGGFTAGGCSLGSFERLERKAPETAEE